MIQRQITNTVLHMTSFTTSLHFVEFFLLLLQVQFYGATNCFSAIFSFGDSLQDTGNYIRAITNTSISKLPWGETYFHKATGRCSNGRLIIDFIAQAIGLPLVPPYMGGVDFSKGANFAFAGATCLEPEELAKFGVNTTGWTNRSLNVQLGWFKELLQSHPELKDPNFLSKSLIMMGGIGGNEYNAAFVQNLPMDKIKRLVIPVVERIGFAITTVIEMGAKTFIVPGNLPIGCIPTWLNQQRSNNPTDYDENGCLKSLNAFARYHGYYLVAVLDKIRSQNPNITIAYADYYGTGMRMFSNKKQFGITEPFKACCGGGHGCDETGPVCTNPENYASWEGFHPTEATYSAISHGLINGPFAIPFLTKQC